MNEITNTALFDIFKACKKSRFDKEPDFDKDCTIKFWLNQLKMAKNDDFKKNSKRYQILDAKIEFSIQKT